MLQDEADLLALNMKKVEARNVYFNKKNQILSSMIMSGGHVQDSAI